MMRFLRYLLGGLFVITLVFAAISTWLIATSSGARMIAAQLPRFLPELQLGDLTGDLLDGLQITELRFDNDSLSVVATDLLVSADLWSLLNLEAVHIHTLHSRDVAITTKPAAEPAPDPAEGLNIEIPALPIVIRIDDAQLGHVHVDGIDINEVSFSGDLLTDKLRIRQLGLETSGVTITAQGSTSVGNVLAVDVTGAWEMDRLSGRLTAKGTLDQLVVQHTFRAYNEQNEPFAVASAGNLDLSYVPKLTGTLDHDLGINGLSLQTRLSGAATRWQFGIAGRYDPWPFSLSAILAENAGTWSLQVANADLAGALTADGTIQLTPTLGGAFSIEATDFKAIAPELHGRLIGNIDITEERIKGKLRFPNLSYSQIQAQSGIVSFSIPMDLEQALSVDLTTTELTIADTKLAQPHIKLDGPLDTLAFSLTWPGTHFSGRLENVRGSPHIAVNPDSKLLFADVALTSIEPISINQTPSGWRVSDHCWRGFAKLCLSTTELENTDEVKLNGSFEELRVDTFNPWLPVEVVPDARLDGTWTWRRDTPGWIAEVDARSSAVAVVLDGQPLQVPDLSITSTVSDRAAQASISGRDERFGVDGSLDVDGLSNDASLVANFNIDANLDLLPRFVEDITSLKGKLTGNATLQGPVTQPAFEVAGNWSEGHFAWQDPEITLSGIEATWFADPQGWRIAGEAIPSQGGRVTVTGQGDAYDARANITARIDGKAIPLEADYWKLTAAPSINVNVTSGSVVFDGTVEVPNARVEIETLPESLPRPSRDVKVVGRAPLNEPATSINGKIRVELGEDVRLKLFVLDIGLKGSLDAQVMGDEVTSLVGELEIYDGSLKASGQTLIVEDGRILFSGDPNNPYVDIIALREIADQTPPLKVGLRIIGPTDNLQTTVYSEPSMAETRALSFLVLGRDFNESSDADSQQMITAAIGFGLKQSQGVVQELRGFLGLDELSALAADQNDVAIVAGKRVTKDLYVRYSYNALSAVGALVIQYHMTNRWRLEATNDATSSMDLLYEFTK